MVTDKKSEVTMTPIDLKDFALTNNKIPADILAPEVGSQPIKLKKFFAAFTLDAAIVLSLVSSLATFFSFSFRSLMMSSKLASSFQNIDYSILMLNILPLTFMSYYFFSYFFNEGQTYGMNKHKIRVEMPAMDFRSSLMWASYSAVTCMSLGAAAVTHKWMTKNGWGTFKTHDHLYMNLIQEKNISLVNLFELTGPAPKLQLVQDAPEENYLKVA